MAVVVTTGKLRAGAEWAELVGEPILIDVHQQLGLELCVLTEFPGGIRAKQRQRQWARLE
jgi:hypothetical protein